MKRRLRLWPPDGPLNSVWNKVCPDNPVSLCNPSPQHSLLFLSLSFSQLSGSAPIFSLCSSHYSNNGSGLNSSQRVTCPLKLCLFPFCLCCRAFKLSVFSQTHNDVTLVSNPQTLRVNVHFYCYAIVRGQYSKLLFFC